MITFQQAQAAVPALAYPEQITCACYWLGKCLNLLRETGADPGGLMRNGVCQGLELLHSLGDNIEKGAKDAERLEAVRPGPAPDA